MKHHKLLFIGALIILQLFVSVGSSKAEEVSEQEATDNTEDIILDRVSLDGVQQYWNELIDDYGGYLPELERMNISEFIKKTGYSTLKILFSALLNIYFMNLFSTENY